jgi:hypothetical protein
MGKHGRGCGWHSQGTSFQGKQDAAVLFLLAVDAQSAVAGLAHRFVNAVGLQQAAV